MGHISYSSFTCAQNMARSYTLCYTRENTASKDKINHSKAKPEQSQSSLQLQRWMWSQDIPHIPSNLPTAKKTATINQYYNISTYKTWTDELTSDRWISRQMNSCVEWVHEWCLTSAFEDEPCPMLKITQRFDKHRNCHLQGERVRFS